MNAVGVFIDVQSHFLPPFYEAAMREAGMQKIDNWDIPQWNVESAKASMDRYGVDAQILSLSAPGVSFLSGQARRAMARQLNEYAAATIRDHAPKFGAFATLPLPDVDGALAELAYALDTLKLDGVALQSNYDGVYLGDAKLDALFDELHRRKAIVFVHPVKPPNFEPLSVGMTAPILEYMFDTTRMATNLLRSGTMERCPDMRMILGHGGGTIPFLYPRLALVLGAERAKLFSSFYYDLTAATMPGQIAALRIFAKPERLMMGLDFPFMVPAMNAPFMAALESDVFTTEERRAVKGENALALFAALSARIDRHKPQEVLVQA